MRKILLRSSGLLFVLIVGFSAYYTLAEATRTKLVTKALSNCSVRMTVVLSHTDHDVDSIAKSIRNINEAIAYVDGVVEDVHVHVDGSVHFNESEQCFTYMKLCGETLRREKSFLESVSELDTLVEVLRERQKTKDAADALHAAELRREQAFEEFMARHKLLREALTEVRNETIEILGALPEAVLVDMGAIEHAQREIDNYPTRWSSLQ